MLSSRRAAGLAQVRSSRPPDAGALGSTVSLRSLGAGGNRGSRPRNAQHPQPLRPAQPGPGLPLSRSGARAGDRPYDK